MFRMRSQCSTSPETTPPCGEARLEARFAVSPFCKLARPQHRDRQHRHLWRILSPQLLGLWKPAAPRPALLHSLGSRSGAQCGRPGRRSAAGEAARRHSTSFTIASTPVWPLIRYLMDDPVVSRGVPGLCRGDAQHRFRAVSVDREAADRVRAHCSLRRWSGGRSARAQFHPVP